MNYLIFFSNAGVPAPGLTPAVDIFKKVADGEDVVPLPEITEIGGGFYKFPAVPTEPLVVRIDAGAGLEAADRYKVLQITPFDGAIDAAISSRASLGPGGITWTYTLTRSDNGQPIADADVWVSTDAAGQNIVASGRTDQNGVVTFHLDAGTVYVWRQKSGFVFANPDTEVVS